MADDTEKKEAEQQEQEPLNHPAIGQVDVGMDTNMYKGTAHGEPVGPMNQGTGVVGGAPFGNNDNLYPLNPGDVTQAYTTDGVEYGPVVGQGGKTVKLYFPHPVNLAVENGKVLNFRAGEQEVPEQYADHPYLGAHGVRRGKDAQAEVVGTADGGKQQDLQKLQNDNKQKSAQPQPQKSQNGK